MGGISDKALAQVGRFPSGINNVAPIIEAPRDENGNLLAARDLVNVDLDATGRARLRRGVSVIDADPAHSLFDFNPYLLAVVNRELRAYRKAGTTIALDSTLLTGLSERFLSYASDDDSAWWSDGVTNGRIAGDLTTHPFWIGTPDPVEVAASAAGGLAAGSYEVAVTVVDADGRESGASNASVLTLTAGQGIAVTLPAAPEGAVAWRVYRSTPDGEVLYLVTERPIATTALTLGEAITEKPLQTAWLFPMLPCYVLRYGHGRLVGLIDGGLIWTEAARIGLMRDDSHIGLRAGTLLEPLGEGGDAAGWFVADDRRTYWFAGADPQGWRQRIVYPHPAVPGTSLLVSGSVFGLDSAEPVAVWLASNGVWCLGLPGGTVQPIRENECALPVNAERGTAAFFQHNGVQQIVTALLGGEANPMNAAMSDTASATIRRHGITL